MSKTKTCFSDLSPEIVFDILAKVPIKSLLHCRSVAKLWREIIDDPRFVTTQRTNEVPEKSELISYSSRRGQDSLWCIHSNGLDKLKLYKYSMRQLPVNVDYPSLQYVCNGLIFFYHKLLVSNPLTGEYVQLPPLPPSPLSPLFSRHIYGVGFDFKCQVYKVVYVRIKVYGGNDGIQVDAFVLNLGGTWRQIECDCELTYINQEPIVTTRGYLHWLAYNYRNFENENDTDSLLSFDIEKEKFTLTPCPKATKSFTGRSYLTCWNQSVVVVYLLSSIKQIEVWVLKNDESREWTKMVKTKRVGLDLWYTEKRIKLPRPCVPIRLIGEWNDGLLFEIVRNTNYMLYNPNNHNIEFLEVADGGDRGKLNVFIPTFAPLT